MVARLKFWGRSTYLGLQGKTKLILELGMM